MVDLLGSAPRSKTLPRAALRPVETIPRPILVFSMETSRTGQFVSSLLKELTTRVTLLVQESNLRPLYLLVSRPVLCPLS